MPCNSKAHRIPKNLPYGATKGHYWCWGCDAEEVLEWTGPKPKPIKKSERQRANREIRAERARLGK